MYRYASVVIACLMTASAASAETLTTACIARNRTVYNVVPDGARAPACRLDARGKPDQRVRLLEVVDTTRYQNVRGFGAHDNNGDMNKIELYSVGNPTYLEVFIETEENGAPHECSIYVWIDPTLEFVNLRTQKKGLQQLFDVTLLQVTHPGAAENREGVSYMLSTGEIFRFSNLFLAWDFGDQLGGCFGALTVERDKSARMFAK